MNVRECTTDEIASWLKAARDVRIVDIRQPEDYAEWHIPGSTNVPVYDALGQGDVEQAMQALASITGPQPVVAVCHRGNTSRAAAQLLKLRGLDAYSLQGGMRAWSGVWSVAVLPSPGVAGTVFLQVRRNGKGCLSYLLGAGGEAAVFDPSVEIEAYLDLAKRHGCVITQVFETHVHADHWSRARSLCSATGALLRMPGNDRVQFPYDPLEDAQRVPVGGIAVTVMTTPGHTGESVCYRVGEDALLSGDTVFTDSVGRPDLEKGDEGAGRGAEMLHRSLLSQILALSDGTMIYPAHTSSPLGFDGVPVVRRLADLRPYLVRLTGSRSEFVRGIVESLPPKPPNFSALVAANEGRLELGSADPLDLEAGPNRCAVSG